MVHSRILVSDSTLIEPFDFLAVCNLSIFLFDMNIETTSDYTFGIFKAFYKGVCINLTLVTSNNFDTVSHLIRPFLLR